MKALISPLEPVDSGYRIVQVESEEFAVAEPYFWTDCPDNCNATTWYYDVQQSMCTEIPVPVPTADQNRQTAMMLLQNTDWTTIPDVSDPTKSNPYLSNSDEFVVYRNAVRQYAVYPQAGNINWPTEPVEDWQQVQFL